jgi:hypothetical protein
MADDLSVAFERLSTSTQRLNKACDAAAQTVRDVEAYLEETQTGVEASTPVETIEYGEYGENQVDIVLVYEKYKQGKYRITICHYSEPSNEHDEGVDRQAWSEATRDLKIQCFEKLPNLLIEIAKKVDERVAQAERIVTEVTSKLPLPKKRKGSDK